MTVGQLIEALQRYPVDQDIVAATGEDGAYEVQQVLLGSWFGEDGLNKANVVVLDLDWTGYDVEVTNAPA